MASLILVNVVGELQPKRTLVASRFPCGSTAFLVLMSLSIWRGLI